MLEAVLKKVDAYFDELVDIRRTLHKHPELSFEEVKTPAFIADYLEKLGVNVRRGVGGRGVVGTIKGGKPGPTVALRADFDALPIQEETGLPYQSTVPGVMHACGHDGHTATLLIIAKILMEHRQQLEGSVVLIHQFAEELAPGGAIAMIEDGCLDGVDVIYGTHLWATMPAGEIGYRSGAFMAAADKFAVTIYGKGGHGAAPHETVDAVTVGASVVQQLQQIISRNVDPLESAVVTVASFQAGGPFNVIADKANLVGTVRTFKEDIQDMIIERMERTIKGVCDAAGATYAFAYDKGYPAVINHPKETDDLKNAAVAVVGEEHVAEMAPVMGGEDFAYYLHHVPGAFFFTGAGNEDEGIIYPHHHPKFMIDERSLTIAAKTLLTATLSYSQKDASAHEPSATSDR